MQKERSGFAACSYQSKIYFCGGNGGGAQGGTILQKFDCLDLKKGKWAKLPDLTCKRDELQITLGPDGQLYAIGGYGNVDEQPPECLNSAERYCFETQKW